MVLSGKSLIGTVNGSKILLLQLPALTRSGVKLLIKHTPKSLETSRLVILIVILNGVTTGKQVLLGCPMTTPAMPLVSSGNAMDVKIWLPSVLSLHQSMTHLTTKRPSLSGLVSTNLQCLQQPLLRKRRTAWSLTRLTQTSSISGRLVILLARFLQVQLTLPVPGHV